MERQGQHPTMKERFRSQARFSSGFLELPAELCGEETQEWRGKKQAAANRAIEKATSKMHQDALEDIRWDQEQEDYDEDDCLDDPMHNQHRSTIPEERHKHKVEDIRKFVTAVKDCVYLTAGFDVLGLRAGDDKNCLCPCGKDMVRWQEEFKVCSIVARHGQRTACVHKKTLNGLMQHIRHYQSSCVLHFALTIYLETLQSKDEGSHRHEVGHKGMCDVGDTSHKLAVAAEALYLEPGQEVVGRLPPQAEVEPPAQTDAIFGNETARQRANKRECFDRVQKRRKREGR